MPFHHKNIRLPHQDYLGPRWYFITICCPNRRKRFTAPKICDDFLNILRSNAATHSFAIHAYCLMPDHGPPARRRPPAPERSRSVHARHQNEDLNAIRKKNRQSSLAEEILRPHSSQQRLAGRSRSVHLDEPGSRESMPTSRGISVLGFPHQDVAANVPIGCGVASPLAQTRWSNVAAADRRGRLCFASGSPVPPALFRPSPFPT